MGVKSSLNPEITPKGLIDLWLFNFAKHKDSIDLSSYEDTIQFNMADIINQGGTHTNEIKTFPVIFHAIIDTPKLLTPSGGDIIDFNVSEILKDVNYGFRNSGIQFKAVANDEDGNALDYPGLNIINALNLQTQRINTTTSTPSANDMHRYTENGVAISDRYETDDNQNTAIQEGVSLDSIYSKFSWNSDRVINIFLINGFSSSLLDVQYTPALIASNPFLYDSIKLDGGVDVNFNITLPFWALGRPYIDAETPGYGYRYTTVEEDTHDPEVITGTHYINNQIASKLTAVATSSSIDSLNYYGGYYTNDSNKALVLIKGLGHLFGLTNAVNVYPTEAQRVFTTGGMFSNQTTPRRGICYATRSSSTNCFYKSFDSPIVALSDCSEDTARSGGVYVTNERPVDELCDTSEVDGLDNYMHNSNIVGNSIYATNNFSDQQILRMNANINLNYLDTITSQSIQGVFKRILSTNTKVYDFESVISCTSEDDSKTLSANRSLAVSFDQDKLNANELFEQTKNNITNIVNTF